MEKRILACVGERRYNEKLQAALQKYQNKGWDEEQERNFREAYADGFETGFREGVIELLISLVQEGVLDRKSAIERAEDFGIGREELLHIL